MHNNVGVLNPIIAVKGVKRRHRLGAAIAGGLPDGKGGAGHVKVTSDGAASKAGIQQGDVIVKLDGKDITTYKSFLTVIQIDKMLKMIRKVLKD